MDRRSFLKTALATAAVGAVAPKLLAAPANPWALGVDTAAGASRVVVGATQYEIVLDISDWSWKWLPVSNARFIGGGFIGGGSMHQVDVYPRQIEMGVTEYDPATGCWPTKDVNEDGTVKHEALKRVWPDWPAKDDISG